jgi:hypothetical protein
MQDVINCALSFNPDCSQSAKNAAKSASFKLIAKRWRQGSAFGLRPTCFALLFSIVIYLLIPNF